MNPKFCSFIAYYRIDKEAFYGILSDINLLMHSSSITVELKLAATLRLPAQGGFQRSVGKDALIFLARTTVCRILHQTLEALEKTLCSKWIKLGMTQEEVRQSKAHFCKTDLIFLALLRVSMGHMSN